ncbi:MAG: hypothetical protein B6U72_06580 [Candidatus Altiarchaeales archaeon ex4484_2]|nr:MAG: hypothetical protein B6U72_06580 [Candidatus Altiarchaeales archaeon ex4484_2]
MDWMSVFLSQVTVLFIMLVGMLVGDAAASSIFGRVQGSVKQIIYLFFFVVFLVAGNYIPSLLGLPVMGLYVALLLFGLWGFLSVFASRGMLYVMGHAFVSLQGVICPSRTIEKINLDGGLFYSFLKKKLKADRAKNIAGELIDSRKGSRAYINPKKLSSVFDREGLTEDDVLYVLVDLARMSPEKAVFFPLTARGVG